MKSILLVLLLVVAIAMIVLGVKLSILPPALTGIGFIIITILFYQRKN